MFKLIYLGANLRRFLFGFGILCIFGVIAHMIFVDEPTAWRLVPLVCGLISICSGGIMHSMHMWSNSMKEAQEFTLRASKYPLPSKFIPFTAATISKDELLRFQRILTEISPLIESGNTRFTRTELLGSGLLATMYLNQALFIKNHRVLSILIILLCIPVGFIPLLFYATYVGFTFKSLSKVEEIFMAFYNSTLMVTKQTQAAPVATSNTDELGKLFLLFKSGALSSAEFDDAKKKILQKVV